MPKRLHDRARELLKAIYTADTRTGAVEATRVFAAELSSHPKATAKVTGELDTLLAFFDFPAEHWKHLRTTNAIESTFATVRLRQRTTEGPGSRAAGVAMMAYKLMDAAQDRWRRINGHELVALVRAGAIFIDGKLQERSTEDDKTTRDECAA